MSNSDSVQSSVYSAKASYGPTRGAPVGLAAWHYLRSRAQNDGSNGETPNRKTARLCGQFHCRF